MTANTMPSRSAPTGIRSVARHLLALASCLVLAACTHSTERVSDGGAAKVTRWTLLADAYANGQANLRTLPIMHMAMHDALNAAKPTYARWAPATPEEPAANGADPEVAMAAAAYQVLLLLHPDRHRDTERALQVALSGAPPGAAKDAGLRLGTAIGADAVQRRSSDGYTLVRYFVGNSAPGKWVPTPKERATSVTNSMRPFLFAAVTDVPFNPPPTLDSPEYLRDLAETQRIGSGFKAERSVTETKSALFWAGQSSQRGFVHLAVDWLGQYPRRGGVFEDARIMAQLTNAMADSAILVWTEKEKFAVWRPITAIRYAGSKTGADQDWVPLLETPPFPEYPSGHAGDCYVGAGVLQASFPDVKGPVVYTALDGALTVDTNAFGMGQHAQAGGLGGEQTFPTLAAAAEDCAKSRIWAGAHFLSGDEEARRLGSLIVQRAVATVPPL